MFSHGAIKGIVFLLCCMGVSLSWGNETALFSDVFPTSNRWKTLSIESGSASAPQLLEARNGTVLLGYGVVLFPVSRSGRFRILVAISPDETVMSIRIPNYPHRRGRSVCKKSFLKQFNGVSYGKPLVLGRQVDGVSGATSSASALVRAVRQALLLVHWHQISEK